eukprot:gene986-13018_t
MKYATSGHFSRTDRDENGPTGKLTAAALDDTLQDEYDCTKSTCVENKE